MNAMSIGMPPGYQYDRSTFDVDDAGLPKYTPAHPPPFSLQPSDFPHPDRRQNQHQHQHQHEFGYNPHATQQAPTTRRPTSRGRPLPPTPGGPRPMQQPPVVHAPPPHPPPPPPVTIPSSPPPASSMSMSPLTPALTGSSTSSDYYSLRSPPPPRPSLPPVAENIVSIAPKTPGHTCAGRSLNIVFYRGDATALPMYGRGDRIEGHIDLKNIKDICQIEITFEGMLNVTFTEHGLPYDQANVPLFSSTQTVFGSGNGGVPRSTYEFDFPIPTTIPSSHAVLPPTWHIHHPGAEADVLYQVRVVVTRKFVFVKKSEKVICKIEYYPRNVPPQNPSLERGGKKDIELSYNLPPMGKQEQTFGRSVTTLTTVLSIPRPLVYASGSIIQYTVAFTCRTSSSVPALLTASVTLLKSQTAILHNRKSSKEAVVAKGEIHNVDFQPNDNGGTRILKGIMVAGKEGEELSWKLEGMAEVKYTLRLVVAPKEEFKEQFAEFNSLPSFEHREEVTLTTDSYLSSREEASWPSPAIAQRRATHTLGAVLTRHSSGSSSTVSTRHTSYRESFLP